MERKYSAQSLMSKKRFNEIKELLINTYGIERLNDTLEKICEIMHFDPEASTYTPNKGKKIMANRKKRAEELGVSTYVTSGAKAFYDKQRKPIA
jgi:hypothetical protein